MTTTPWLPDSNSGYDTNIKEAIQAIREGRMVIMVDEADRENEGDLVFAAEFVSAKHINFMAKEARGLICLTLEPSMISKLNLPLMKDSTKVPARQCTAFTVSIEARSGVTTGISAADRAHTIRVAVAEGASADDIVVPGHIFPLKACEGGVLERAGHTEGSVDIAKLAGLKGAGVICEIMNDDGTMARMPDLEEFSKKHNIPIVAISDLIKFRLHQEALIKEVSRGMIETYFGSFEAVLFENVLTAQSYVAFVKGNDFGQQVVDVRVHSQRPFADVFADSDSSAGFRLSYGLNLLSSVENGVFLYLTADNSHELFAKDFSLLCGSKVAKNPSHHEPIKMDDKMLGIGAQILRHLGICRMRIHSTSMRNFSGLAGYGLEVVETHLVSTSTNSPKL